MQPLQTAATDRCSVHRHGRPRPARRQVRTHVRRMRAPRPVPGVIACDGMLATPSVDECTAGRGRCQRHGFTKRSGTTVHVVGPPLMQCMAEPPPSKP
eukprot:363634-Chlamydomonas_euryale.AAC.5